MRDDLIDFPISPDWAAHYARQGMTPVPPAQGPPDHAGNELAQRLDTLESWIRHIAQQTRPAPYNEWFQSEATARATHALLNIALHGQANARPFPGDSVVPSSPTPPPANNAPQRPAAPARAPEL